MDKFISFLESKKKKRENLEWPSNTEINFQQGERSIKDVVKEWTQTRLCYPNWVILPRKQRNTLWDATKSYSGNESVFADLDIGVGLDYVYELAWRHERCLFSFFNGVVPHIESVVDKYNPFSLILKQTREISDDNPYFKGLKWSDIRIKWAAVSLSLLRFYREEGFTAKWDSLQEVLLSVYLEFSPEFQASFFYERILKASFDADIVRAKSLLREWPTNPSTPFWEAKRASLLSEFGQPEEAVKILESSLLTIRKRLNLSPVDSDYNWVSQEAYVMFLLHFIKQDLRFKILDMTYDDTHFNERWSNLLQYRCDPWSENNYFQLVLSQPFHGYDRKVSKRTFEISVISTTYVIGGSNSEGFHAYTFFRFMEEIGIPLSLRHISIGKDTILGGLDRIMLYSPFIGLGILERCNNPILVSAVFSRAYIQRISSEQANHLINHYLDKFEEFLPEFKSNSFAESFVKKLPAILLRLAVKSNKETKLRMYRFCHQVYNSTLTLPEFGTFVKMLLEVSPATIICDVLPLLIDTPLVSSSHSIKSEIIDPFEDIRSLNGRKCIISSTKIIDLLSKANNPELRISAVRRLLYLHTNELLTLKQSERMIKLIWKDADKNNGFPANTSYYKFYYITLPHPKSVDNTELFKEYIYVNNFKIQTDSGREGISMSGGKDSYAHEVLSGSLSINNADGVSWTEPELEKILGKCELWWEKDKHFLIEEKYKSESFGHSICTEFQMRFRYLSNILARVYGYQKETITDPKIKNRILTLITDMDTKGVPVLKAKAMFSLELGISGKQYISEVQKAVTAGEHMMVIEALESALYVVYFNLFNDDKEFENKMLEFLVQPLTWRMHELMPDFIDAIKEILKEKNYLYESISEALLDTLNYIKNISEDIGEVVKVESTSLLLRKKGMLLSRQLYDIIKDVVPIPERLQQWVDIAYDPDEFGDITIHWNTDGGI